MMVGPLAGGLMVMQVGLGATYVAVGGSIALLALVNRVLIPETHRRSLAQSSVKRNPVRDSMVTWKALLRDVRVRKLVAFQAIYWSCLSGVQFTMLPLQLVALGFTPQQLGICFATVSAVNFITSQVSRRGCLLD
jgi:hypothetical protein